MPFDLFYTTTEGRTYKALRSPYPDRASTRQTVSAILYDQLDRHHFASNVEFAELGEELVHKGTGITFRTEES